MTNIFLDYVAKAYKPSTMLAIGEYRPEFVEDRTEHIECRTQNQYPHSTALSKLVWYPIYYMTENVWK